MNPAGIPQVRGVHRVHRDTQMRGVRGARRGTQLKEVRGTQGNTVEGGLQRGSEGPRSVRGHFAESLGNFVACPLIWEGLRICVGKQSHRENSTRGCKQTGDEDEGG